MQLIELREVADETTPADDVRSFPIVIGLPEAMAIERRLGAILNAPSICNPTLLMRISGFLNWKTIRPANGINLALS
jgi:hypothetical protein